MSKIVVANWKANPDSPGRAEKLAREIDAGSPNSKSVEVIIAPPFPFLQAIGKILKKTKLGAQDVFWGDIGAYTGEVSWHQLKHLKVSYVIIGHSERRRLLAETDEIINKKVLATLENGLKAILCVGEPIAVRRKGLSAAKNFVKNQLKKDLKNIHNSLFKIHNSLIIAYEPVWAIGTGKADKPGDTLEMAEFIKHQASSIKHQVPVLYGGSVTPKNAANFLKYKEIDGALIGGASLKAREFRKIIEIASQRQDWLNVNDKSRI